MIKGISVAYIHTPNKELADWYHDKLGLKKGYGDDNWQAFETNKGSTFALDFISYPSSTVQKQSIMLSFDVDDIHAAVEGLAEKGVRFYPDNDKSKTVFDVGPALVAGGAGFKMDSFHRFTGTRWSKITAFKRDFCHLKKRGPSSQHEA